MDRHYFVVKGQLTKGGMSDRPFRYLALGIQDAANEMEAKAFCNLIHETITITRGRGRGFACAAGQMNGTLEEIAREAAFR